MANTTPKVDSDERYNLIGSMKLVKHLANEDGSSGKVCHRISIEVETNGLDLDEVVQTQLDALGGLTTGVKEDKPQA